jgi:tRNA (cmo5U34)-methyltransferase
MNELSDFNAMFSGTMGQEYQLLLLVCPLAAQMSQLVGESVAAYGAQHPGQLQVVELGGGTGMTTQAILAAADNVIITSVDNEPTMQRQAKENLQAWQTAGKLVFSAEDALTALQKLPTASVDVIASAYTLHNFLASYRAQVISEIFRVLKPGGQLINGDRYALDEISAHTATIQTEVTRYFKVFTAQRRLDLLEQWTVHLFSDESEDHLMRESAALQQLAQAGFVAIQLTHRAEVNALVTAIKP